MKAIVTGHSRGLGAAIAEVLLSRRIPVLGIARTPHRTLGERFPDALEQVDLDLADVQAVERWLARGALAGFLAGAPAALLVNNAGVLRPIGPLETQPPDAVARAVAVNVAAPLMLSAAFAAHTREARDRRIVHISSGAARTAYAGWNVYCATKAALDHHARAVALDGSRGIRICSIAPGVVDTEMQAEVRASPIDHFPLRDRFEAMQRKGDLASPGDAGRRVVEYALGDDFGEVATIDLRPPAR